MKNGPYPRFSACTIRRFLLRRGFVMAAAGPDPPWPPLLKGGKERGAPSNGEETWRSLMGRKLVQPNGGGNLCSLMGRKLVQPNGGNLEYSRGEISTPRIGSFQQPRACRFGGIVPGGWGPYDIRWPRSTGMSLIGDARAYGNCRIASTLMQRVFAHTP